ncbi:hypothetical protein QWZ08_16415 [Ferruginibacter paludis]|uniref:hypothetical protein n=1 Tax=Ferruginibacter paludis TaxID=1310417 RepID=UPI0025B50AEB|nr:hypothetical protein [Ferruginibacter paludis]MDN3657235.1 hypothetical protein [Ferruginibacter paludis]
MTQPKLAEQQFAIGSAEFSTGHILKKNGELFLTGDDFNDFWQIFNSFEQAKAFIIEKISRNRTIECWVIDFTGKTIFFYNKNGEQQLG